MTSQETLSIALVVALSSNIVLLIVVLLKCSNVTFFNESPARLEEAGRDVSGSRFSSFVNPDVVGVQHGFSGTPQASVVTSAPGFLHGDHISDNHLMLRLLKNHLMQSDNTQKHMKLDNMEVSDSFPAADYVNNNLPSALTNFKQLYYKDFPGHRRNPLFGPLMGDIDLSVTAETWDMATPTNTTPFKNLHKNGGRLRILDIHTNYFNANEPSDRHQKPTDKLLLKRTKKEAVAPSSEPLTDGKLTQRVHEIFATFTDVELAKFEPAVYDLLIPALVHFETMVIRELEHHHSLAIAHDYRLEIVEKFMLNTIKENSLELQSDSTDNKSEPDSPLYVLRKEAFMPAGNNTGILEISLETEGSGETEWRPPTTSPQPTTQPNVAFYDMYRILSTLEQKVMALENYNVMSDSELTRVRSEVIKMDDKVTELDRQQRNLQIRTSMHTQKISEWEVYVSKSELGIHTALDSYSRVNFRLETFKDKLTEFKNDLQAVAVQFSRHDQITNELRAADSYKAHDIQEMRKSLFGIEGRLNGLYGVMDHNLDTVRSDLRVMLDRLCANNKLSC